MEHVFISYVRDNSKVVDDLAVELRSRGIRVWLDRESIAPGRRWKQAIREAIEQGVFFIACFSKEYHGRSKTYMNEELIIAVEELRQRTTENSWFIPVLLNDCELPNRDIGGGESLRSIQHIELYKDWPEGIRKIVSAIRPDSSFGKEIRKDKYHPRNGVPVKYSKFCAIDFGTSYSCIAILDELLNPIIIPATDGKGLVPSVLTVDNNLNYAVGWDAIQNALIYPDTAFINIKRLFNTDEKLKLGNEEYSPAIIASLILKSLKKNAEDFLGSEIGEALVSAPANFNISETNVLAKAFDLAGIKIRRVIGEPNAAMLALYHSLAGSDLQDGVYLALDLGGGTFDVSLIEIARIEGENQIEVLAAVGDNQLGGVDFDESLYTFCLEKLKDAISSSDLTLDSFTKFKLRMDAAKAKLALTSQEMISVIVSDMEVDEYGLSDIRIDICRDDFRFVTSELNKRVRTCITKVFEPRVVLESRTAIDLKKSFGLEGTRDMIELDVPKPECLKAIILAGQGLKIFTVSEIIDDMFPEIPKIGKFQEAAVVRGLCQYAGVVSGDVKNLLFLDTNYSSIGIKCGEIITDSDKIDCSLYSNSKQNVKTLSVLEFNTTIPTYAIVKGIAVDSGDINLTFVERDSLKEGKEAVIKIVILPGVEADDVFDVEVDVDANRTIVIWISVPTSEKIYGFQINNHFLEYFDKDEPSAEFLNDKSAYTLAFRKDVDETYVRL